MPEICPHCHQPIKPAKPRKPALVHAVNVDAMTDAELYAYRKKTAPLEDLKFWLRNAIMSAQLRAGFEALQIAANQTTIPRADFYRQLCALQAVWRKESNARDRQAHIDAGDIFEPQYSRWTPREDVTVIETVFEQTA